MLSDVLKQHLMLESLFHLHYFFFINTLLQVMYNVLGNAGPNASINRCKVFTTCVAKRSCPAQFYLNDVEDVESLLNKLATAETTANNNGTSSASNGGNGDNKTVTNETTVDAAVPLPTLTHKVVGAMF